MSKLDAAAFAAIRERVAQVYGEDTEGLRVLDEVLARVADRDPANAAVALARANTIAQLGLDASAVSASLLAPGSSEAELVDCSPELRELVDGVERLAAIRWDQLGSESSENLRRMFVAMAADVRVVLLVLAHRVQVMRSLERGSAEARAMASETLEVFAPLANRLGVWNIKWELEDLSLKEIEPEIYLELKRLLAETRGRRDAYVGQVMDILREALDQHGIEGKITGRPKHIYSIYKKMQRKQVGFDQIYDVSAVRIIVDELKDCYAVLGLVHGLWSPIPGEFDDYIARPKENGYQSLHTAVVGPEGKSVEIQIRTAHMHEFGEYGVAAHWAYKEGGRPKADAAADRKFNVLRQLMDWHKDLEDPTAFAETLKTDLFRDQVYVFTPTGEVLALPAGATPVDFAYRIHTMVGHRCRGAVVNGQIVPLHTQLQNGDRVEILTKKEPGPSRDWLNPHANYLHSSGTRAKVRQWFREQGRDDAVAAGRELFERERKRLGLVDPKLEDVLETYRSKTVDELYAFMGFGDVNPAAVAGNLYEAQRAQEDQDEEPLVSKRAPQKPKRGAASGLRVDGIDGVMGEPANCCKPVPGDPVIGFISRGRGVVVHRRDCPNILHAQEPERLMEVDWSRDQSRRYPVKVDILVNDGRGVLRDVAGALSDIGINLSSTQSRRHEDREAQTISATLEIREQSELARAIARLQRLPCVLDVHRADD
jgi:GTP pyrophosphokinase